MRIINTTENRIAITDLDRGNIGSQAIGIYENWNAKGDSVVPAGSGSYIDVMDTERVMLSTELGQIKTLVGASKLTTEYSITGRGVGPFNITVLNNVFEVQANVGVQSFTLPTGSAIAMTDIVNAINTSATGFVAQESDRFFRSSNVDDILCFLLRSPFRTMNMTTSPSV